MLTMVLAASARRKLADGALGTLLGGGWFAHKSFREQIDKANMHISGKVLKTVVSALSTIGMYLFTCCAGCFSARSRFPTRSRS
jgi:hypothetical protein